MSARGAIAVVLWLALTVSFPAQSREETFVIRGVRVFDGTAIAENQTVVIASGKIAAIGTSVDAPAGAIDVPGKDRTLLPGLIDSHVHVGIGSAVEALQQSLAFGVTTVLDMWTTPVSSKWKEIEKADRADLASIRGAGNGATVPGGHPTQMDGGAGARFIPTLSTPAEAEAFVAARVAEGSDFIKIIYADQAIFGRALPTLDEPTIAALVAAAHARDRLAVAHIGDERTARGALAAGVDGLAHLFVGTTVSPDFGRFVASTGAFVIPTLAVLRWVCGMPDGPSIAQDESTLNRIKPQFRNLLNVPMSSPAPSCEALSQAVRQLIDAGVPILAGTDAPAPGSSHGASLHWELEHLVEAGMTPAAALAAATSVPARRFRMVDRGRIAPGLRADLLLVEGDPSREIRDTRRIVGVWKRGVRVAESSQP
jgi:cytosine/adenosine deaminase-related metal-dependent hydrolase